MTYGIGTGYNLYDNYNYLNYNNGYNTQSLLPNTSFNGSIYQNSSAGSVATTQQQTKTDNVADGKDDGNIGFWKAAGNFLKGAVKFVVSPFTDEQGNFSIGKTLKTVILGAVISAIPGGIPIALAAGLTLGGIGMVKAGANIMTASTDAEAEAAWQSMGSSTTAVAASLYGAKKYASAKAGADVSLKDSVKTVFKDSGSTIKAGFNKLTSESPSSLWAKGKAKVTSAKDYATGLKDDAVSMYKEYKALSPDERKIFWDSLKAEGNDALHTAYENSGLKDAASTSFKDMASKIAQIARSGFSKGSTAIKGISPERQAFILGTASLAGRTEIKPDFYGQLNAQEQKYYDSLPAGQQQALIDQYYAAA